MSTDTGAAPGAGSALGPFRQRAFAWLWLGVVVASVGMWAQTVGAQRLLVDDPNAFIASQQLGLQAGGYGLLFAALGAGAVLGALTLGRLTAHLSSNALLSVVGLAYAAALAGTMLAPGMLVALPLLVVAGYAWTATVSTVNAELQLFLPSWVRARAIAVYLMSFLGTMAIASPLWGLLTQHAGLPVAAYTAAALVAAGAVAGLTLRIPESHAADRAALEYWNDPSLGIAPEPDAGPVQVIVEYHVPPEHETDWLAAMQDMRRSRLRSGAFRWELYRIGERPDRFLEIFAVPSWAEHERQHQHRLTAEDQAIEEAAFAHTTTTPTAEHLPPPQPPADRTP